MIRSLIVVLSLAASASAAPVRIVTFGDSTTAPRTLPNGSALVTYSDIMRDELPALLDREVDVINAGVGGNLTTHAVARMSNDVLAHDPDYVVVQFGINDAFVVNGATPQLPLANYISNMQTIISGVRSVGAEPILMTPFPLSYLVWFSNWSYAPYHDRVHENDLNRQYAAELAALADANDVLLIDSASVFYNYIAAHPSDLEHYHLDYVHPNAAAHRLEADMLMAAIAEAAAIPEPATLVLAALGMLGALAWRWRRG